MKLVLMIKMLIVINNYFYKILENINRFLIFVVTNKENMYSYQTIVQTLQKCLYTLEKKCASIAENCGIGEDNVFSVSDENTAKKLFTILNKISGISGLCDILHKYEKTSNILSDIQNEYITICQTLKSEHVLHKEYIMLVYKELSRLILMLDKEQLTDYETLLKVHTLNKK